MREEGVAKDRGAAQIIELNAAAPVDSNLNKTRMVNLAATEEKIDRRKQHDSQCDQ